ncbi:MAG: tRNA adenosine(34) deaminase TadA [Clostridia bacterium]|nr:tRNA adenosine(34) deaminase TadA [Clostridia bacterium]
MNKNDYMKEALKEANKAYIKEEVPVGAIIVKDGNIIAKAHNLKETKKSSICHAEILAIQKACKKLDTWRLINCDMYVTLEPCPMCTGALINSRIRKVYIGTNDKKTGACGSKINLLEDVVFNHKVEIEREIMQQECEQLLKKFFKNLRERNKNGEKRNN